MKSAIQSVLNSTTDQLLNLEYIESLIRRFGLFWDSRNIYGEPYNQWQLLEKGGMYQQPRQISQMLIYLHDKEIKSYLEVGAFYGYTFAFVTAYLSKFGFIGAVAYDTNKYIDDDVLHDLRHEIGHGVKINYMYRDGEIEINGHPSNTKNIRGIEFDLVFIDGNHAYSAVKADYENVGKYARYCAFHDISDEYVEKECEGGGPVRFWEELKIEFGRKSPNSYQYDYTYDPKGDIFTRTSENKNMVEFTYHPENKRVMGIGVIQPGGES